MREQGGGTLNAKKKQGEVSCSGERHPPTWFFDLEGLLLLLLFLLTCLCVCFIPFQPFSFLRHLKHLVVLSFFHCSFYVLPLPSFLFRSSLLFLFLGSWCRGGVRQEFYHLALDLLVRLFADPHRHQHAHAAHVLFWGRKGGRKGRRRGG